MAWNDLSIAQRSQLINTFRHNGVSSLSEMKRLYDLYSPLEGNVDTYNTPVAPMYAGGGDKKKQLSSSTELPAVIVTPDKDYSYFLNSLPDNQRFTPEEEYSTKRYWELNGKPRDFEEAKKLGMYTYDSSDGSYHANSIAWGEDGVGYFMKPKRHDTLKYELDWYNKGILTEEGGKQRPLIGEEKEDWENFRRAYGLDTTDTFYKYIPKETLPLTERGLFDEGGSKIHIKPSHRGKFTALKKRTGHSASWFKAHGTPAQRKMATFELNARHWKHSHGGIKF